MRSDSDIDITIGPSADPPDGFTLVEILIVIVVLGILAAIVVFSVRGVNDRGQDSACEFDERAVGTAVEAYFADAGGSVIPPTGAAPDQYERTLVSYGLLRETSDYWEVNPDGSVTNVTPC